MRPCLCLCYGKSGLWLWWEGLLSGDLDFSREAGVLGRDWASCVCEQEGVGWQQFQVLLSGAWHNSSVEISLQLSVWESDFYHIAKDYLYSCSQFCSQEPGMLWERQSKWILMMKGGKIQICLLLSNLSTEGRWWLRAVGTRAAGQEEKI